MDNADNDMGENEDENEKGDGTEETEGPSLLNLPRLAMHGSDFFPQTVACLAASAIVIHSGAQLAFSAVLLPELMSPHSALPINEDEASWIASIVTISTPFGSLLSGPLMDRFGRKSVCQLTCLPLLLAWITIAFANNVYGLYVGRLLAGVAAGLASASLVYISEVSHQRWRSSLLCIISIFVSLGILLICIMCLWLDYKQMSICFAVFSVVSYVIAWPLPESPHWLLRLQTKQKATRALRWLYRRDLCYSHQLKSLLDSYQSPSTPTSNQHSCVRYFSEYKKPSTLKPIGILMVIFIFQQISGAYVIIFYAVNILKLVGGKYGNSINEYTAFVMLGVIRFAMSILTAFASRKCGRRPVLTISGLGMAASALIAAIYISSSRNSGNLFQNNAFSTEMPLPVQSPTSSHYNNTQLYSSYQNSTRLLIMNNPSKNSSLIDRNSTTDDLMITSVDVLDKIDNTTYFSEASNKTDTSSEDDGHWVPLVCVIVYVFFSSMGVLVIPWTLIGELSPINVRGSCGGFMMAFSYIVMFAVVKIFPYLLHVVKAQGIFYVFSATSLLGAVFVCVCLPETRGKTFEEIEKYFK